MKITQKWAKEKGACLAGRQWLAEHFPEGGEYEAVLEELKKNGTYSGWEEWLTIKAGIWRGSCGWCDDHDYCSCPNACGCHIPAGKDRPKHWKPKEQKAVAEDSI